MPGSIFVASDHAGFEFKERLKEILPNLPWKDLGPTSTDRVDYPDFAQSVALKVAQDESSTDLGILICGSGIGMAIAANKIPGVRAALVHHELEARLAKEHNNANILCLGARFIAPEWGAELIHAWKEASFDPQSRHGQRVKKIKTLEGMTP